ncbi:hypothetical protein D3C76_1268090 [compost metagenome]
MAPRLEPSISTARAVERRCGGYRSETIATDGAVPPASPMATPMRARTRVKKLLAMPQSMVIRLQAMQLKAITGLRPMRSDSRPRGRPNTV